jgi:peptide/nickel transport system permease protein
MAPAAHTTASSMLRRLQRSRLAATGGAITCAAIVIALGAPAFLKIDPTAIDVTRILAAPSAAHPLGTDDFGRDLLSRIVHGSRLSLAVGFSVQMFTVLFGGLTGMIAGYFPVVDAVIMRVMDALMAFPAILLALAVIAISGPATANVVLALGIAYSPRMARLARAGVLSVRAQEYVIAAVALGAPSLKILRRHVVPNAVSAVIVQATFTFAYAILGEAGLSFVGLGAVPPTPSLGNILSDARSVMREAPWMILFPSAVLTLIILGLNLLGDGIRDALDPRIRV